MLTLRFDLRNPAFAKTSSADRLQAAVEMAAWADARDGISVALSEHHGSPDGYLPSPLIVAAGIAARTTRIRISIAALLAPLYDPVRLAEDVAVLDALSGGRIDLILGNGYVASEFEMYGVAMSERARRTTEVIEFLRKAWTGEAFEFHGRTIRVTPRPHQPAGPRLILGGSSAAAARRAARIADGFLPVSPQWWDVYRQECQQLGKPDPGPSPIGTMTTTFLAEDPEAAWPRLMPYFLHETNAYAEWLEGAGGQGPYHRATAEELRQGGQYRVITPEAYAEELRAQGEHAVAMLHPMVGGVPPDVAWECLELYESKVLPALQGR